jgi:PPM family protein phosphatase
MEKISYKFFSATDKGKCYNNEDALLTLDLGNGTYLFAVADGMGANECGELASSISLFAIEKYLKNIVSASLLSNDNMKTLMAELFDAANSAINQFIEDHADTMGMGTTLTALLIHNDKYVWGHIGDSRLYMLHDEHVSRLTRDHTMEEDNPNTSQSLILHRHLQNELTRVMDGGRILPEIYPVNEPWKETEPSTIWILCSDGLLVDRRKDFKELFLNFSFAPEHLNCIATGLVKKALKNGSRDNISVITVAATNQIEASSAKPDPLKTITNTMKSWLLLAV